MTSQPPATRNAAFDGIRGFAIILVVLSHGWTIFPAEHLDEFAITRALLRSGNEAVTIFLVVGGFLATQGLLNARERSGRTYATNAFMRRFVRLSAHTYPLLAVVLLVAALDDQMSLGAISTGDSILHIGTYTWNWYLIDQAGAARPDLGHLWYLSTYLQLLLVLIIAVKVLGGRRLWLAALLGGLALLSFWWQGEVLAHENAFNAMVRTTTRMMPFWMGCAAAALLVYIRPRARWVNALFVSSSVVLVSTIFVITGVPQYLGWWGLLTALAAVGFTVSVQLGVRESLLSRAIGNRAFAFLGARSIGLYAWHYPVFWYVAHHTDGWGWPMRTLLASAACLVFVVGAQRLIEQPLQVWLRTSRWVHPGVVATKLGTDGGPRPNPLARRATNEAELVGTRRHDDSGGP